MGIGLRPLIAGNWKMNGTLAFGLDLAQALDARYRALGREAGVDVLLCPPSTALHAVSSDLARAGSGLFIGGQDCHAHQAGAYTGDISPAMLRDCGARYVILGHSERRARHHERDDDIHAKAVAARAAGLIPIICVGETLAERESGLAQSVICRQLAGSVPTDGIGADLVVAYEPVWAIGTGKIPAAADIAAIHSAIRDHLVGRVGNGSLTRLLYGGSVNAENAEQILALPHVNGALVGGASLSATQFWPIVEAGRKSCSK